MKILLASDAHRTGGAEHYLFLLAKGLRHRGHQVSLLCPDRPEWSELAGDFHAAEIDVHRMPIKNRLDYGRWAFLAVLDFFQISRLKKFFQTVSPDILHVNTPGIESGHTLIYAAAQSGFSSIVSTVHTARYLPFCVKTTSFPLIDLFRKRVVCAVVSRIRKVITISSQTAEGLLERYSFPKDKFVVVPNGVDQPEDAIDRLAAKKTLCEIHGLEESVPLILCVAHLWKEKGVDFLIKALGRIPSGNENFYLIVAGDGPFRDELNQCVLQNGLSDKVRFLGHQADVWSLMRGADIFVLPSLSEGFPFVILEAMSCGRPVVATKVGGIPEMIEDGVQGYLVESGQVEPLADALKKMLADPAGREQMGIRAKAKVRKEFSLSKMIEKTIAVYERVTGDTP